MAVFVGDYTERNSEKAALAMALAGAISSAVATLMMTKCLLPAESFSRG